MKTGLKFFSQISRLGRGEFLTRLRSRARFLRNEEGSIVIYLALAIPVLIGAAGLGVEGGFWLYQKRLLQSAADNAAYSAAAAYAADKSSNITAQARAITANDYDLIDGQNSVTVAVNRPPSGSCHTGPANYTGNNAIEVIVTKPQTPLLSSLWLSSDVNICGRGVAIVPTSGDCILALSATGAAVSTMDKVNNLSINLDGCNIFSDSTSSNSITMNGNNNTINADAVAAAGGIVLNGNAKSTIFNSSTGNPPVADPYASDAASLWQPSQTPLVPPTCAGCGTGTATTTPPSTPTKCDNSHTTITIGPGNWTAVALAALNLNKCTTAIKLSGGTYAFAAQSSTKPVDLSVGGPVTINTASTIIVTGGGLTTGTVNFSSGDYTISVQGDWIGSTTNFGNGNYTFTVGGGWTLNSATTFGNGNYTFAIGGDFTTPKGTPLTMGTGTYSGSMKNWNIGGNTTIGSGIYYLSGNFNINNNGGNQTVTANHVTLVLTGATSIVDFEKNNSTFTLTAPTSGWNSGIAIWEPNSTGTNQLATGNSSIVNVTGVIYAPQADVQYVGNTGATTTCTQIIAGKVEFGGNSINITASCDSVPGVKIFGQIAALVE